MSDDLTILLKRLIDAGVEFVLVGGFAGVVYGCNYVTKDVDICFEFSTENLLALQEALSGLEPVHRMTPKKKKLQLTKDNCGNFKNLYLATKMGQLDCLSFIDGIGDYEKVRKSSRIIQVGKIKMRALSLDALIKSKKKMNRPRDMEVVKELEAIKKLNTSD